MAFHGFRPRGAERFRHTINKMVKTNMDNFTSSSLDEWLLCLEGTHSDNRDLIDRDRETYWASYYDKWCSGRHRDAIEEEEEEEVFDVSDPEDWNYKPEREGNVVIPWRDEGFRRVLKERTGDEDMRSQLSMAPTVIEESKLLGMPIEEISDNETDITSEDFDYELEDESNEEVEDCDDPCEDEFDLNASDSTQQDKDSGAVFLLSNSTELSILPNDELEHQLEIYSGLAHVPEDEIMLEADPLYEELEFLNNLQCHQCQAEEILPTFYWSDRNEPFLCNLCLVKSVAHQSCQCILCTNVATEIANRLQISSFFIHGMLFEEKDL